MRKDPKTITISLFGGTVRTDEAGKFTISELIPGQTYDVHFRGVRTWVGVKSITLKGPGAIALGDVKVNPEPVLP